MKAIAGFNPRRFLLPAVLLAGLGFVTHASAQEEAYLIDLKAKTATDLGNVTATALNDAGQVVGYSGTANGGSRAFITGPNGVGMRDLGTLGGITVMLLPSTTPGRWREIPACRLLSLAPMAWA